MLYTVPFRIIAICCISLSEFVFMRRYQNQMSGQTTDPYLHVHI